MRKTEIITFRTDRQTRDQIAQMASQRKWTCSFVIEEAVKAYLYSFAKTSDSETQKKAE